MKRIVVFIENGLYYSNYVYVEANGQKPTKVNKKYYSREHIEDLKKDFNFVNEEFAIYRPCALYKKNGDKARGR